ncbi:MAG TPA: hypothetical protein VG497_08935 [Kribbella sp.]|nr:hypothetical protein [Kribbella sp.]
MFEQEHLAEHDAALHAQLRLFCELMLGSTEAADSALQQIHRRALDDDQKGRPPDCLQLFRIAAHICGAHR